MRRRVVAVVTAGTLALAAVVAWSTWSSPGSPASARISKALADLANRVSSQQRAMGIVRRPTSVTASGFVQAEEVIVSTEVAGQVQALSADVGDSVAPEQVLAQLDTASMDALLRRAQARVHTAQASLAQVRAGASADELEAARAALTSAEEEVALAEQAVALAEANVAAADAALGAARAEQAKLLSSASPTDLSLAQAQLELAQSHLRGAQSARASIGGASERGELPEASHEAARAAVAQAEIGVRTAQLQIEELQAGPRQEDVEVAQAAVDEAQAQADAARAKVTQAERLLDATRAGERYAQAQLDLALMGATDEQLAMAQAQVNSALAARQSLVVQKQKMTLRAPRAGLVLERPVSMGETLLPGSVLFRLADLDEVDLTVYVPTPDLGQIRLGQAVRITVDSFPERAFFGRVVQIAAQAEFTPRNVQSEDASTTQVFAVGVRVPNADHVLKPGMPADAIFLP